MPFSQSRQLTKQFYAWERKGRGHTVADFPAELEPPFAPFFGHFLDTPYIDDGRVPTLLSRVKEYFFQEQSVAVPEIPAEEAVALADAEEVPALTIYSVTLPKNYVPGAESMEHCLTMLSLAKQSISFEVIATASSIDLQIACRDKSASFIYTQLRAYFPECSIRETYDDEVWYCAQAAQAAYTVDFGLQEEFMRPLGTMGNGHHDPYVSLFATFERLREDEAVVLQVLFCGTQNAWSESVIASVTDDKGGSFFLDAPEMPNLAKEKVSRPLSAVAVRVAAFADYAEEAGELLQHSALALIQASASHCNSLQPLGDPEYTVQKRLCDLVLRQSHRVGMLLNTKELATLVHFPNAQLSKKLLKRSGTTKPAPAFLRNQTYSLGANEHQGDRVQVSISLEQRLKHLHLLGATGQGKSTLLHNLICQDIESGIGCCVIDPHGDLADAVLRSVPKERVGDVVLIDPSDRDHPVGFNILSAYSDLERELLASDLVELFRRFSTSWGDQMHGVLANAIMAFLYNGKSGHLGDLRKFLIDPQFRAHVLATCTDEELTYYWKKEYPLLKTSSIGSILTRLDSFLRPKVIRAMVCQHKGLNFSALMDSKKIILVKLSQGLIGTENSYLLGAVIVAKLQQAAMARQQQAANTRQPFFCYVDEFHNFITPSMTAILSGARKYGLGLILAHQDMQQVQRGDADIAGSLMSNVGTRICFRLSDTDAKRMQEGFSAFSAEDLQSLQVGEAVARVNAADADFNLSISVAEQQADDYADEIIVASRAQYAVQLPQEPQPIAETQPQETVLPIPQNRTDQPQHSALETEAVADKSAESVREHRYLQSFIKAMAEQQGYRASIESQTPNGTGIVDVVAERDGERIAVEISVSTGADWELHNIRKCLAGDYTTIVVCSSSRKKLQAIAQKVRNAFTPADQARIKLLHPDDIPAIFASSQRKSEAATTMKGYRVKVKYEQSDGVGKGDIIQRIMRSAKAGGKP